MCEPTTDELKRCTEILERLVENRLPLALLATEERRALMIAAGKVSRPERLEIRKLAKTYRKVRFKKERTENRMLRASAGIRKARQAETFVPPTKQLIPHIESSQQPELTEPRHCYVCKTRYTFVHFFYDSMCKPCGDFNYEKRFQTTSLHGRTALITGSRVKIGFQASLMLLRAGARVISTTRFPHDSALRYAKESDFDSFKDRLHIFGLDLRHSPSVEIFAKMLEESFDRLDFILNNAAQTVRRPPQFYSHLIDCEREAEKRLSPESSSVLQDFFRFRERLIPSRMVTPNPGIMESTYLAAWQNMNQPGVGIFASAALSQLPCAFDQTATGAELFPSGELDADEQQVDLRRMNSWRMGLADVPTPELLEVQLVNAVAPFILCSKLKPMMMRERTDEKHIVNVSAMEGIFSRKTKTDRHPHTNMAKAALNMMTLTSAPDYANEGIFMNAVDTGWVTDEDPVHLSKLKQDEHDFQPPLDIIDGAARICDPIFSGLLTGTHVWGKFLKDYRPSNW